MKQTYLFQILLLAQTASLLSCSLGRQACAVKNNLQHGRHRLCILTVNWKQELPDLKM